jgi:transcriptional regulator with XRE-family HTH domain
MTAPALPDSVPDAETFRLNGEVMRFVLRAATMTNAGLAERIGVSEATVSRILRGSYTTAAVINRIAAVFPRLTVAEIVDLGDLRAKLPRGALNLPESE